MARGIERRKIFRDSHNRGDLLVRTGSHPLAMNVVTSSIPSPVLFDTKPYPLKGASTSITRFRPMPRVLLSIAGGRGLAIQGEKEYALVGGRLQVHGVFRKRGFAQAPLSQKALVHSGSGEPAEKRTSGGKPAPVLG